MPLKGSAGGSLNNYVTEDKRWHQTWIDSSNARVIVRRRSCVDGKMVLIGDWKGLNGAGAGRPDPRMTYSRVERWCGPASSARHRSTTARPGKPSFDFTYKPSARSPPN